MRDLLAHRVPPDGRARRRRGGDAREFLEGYPGYPDGLIAFAERLRDALEYDVVDERLIADDALKAYRVLLWPTGFVAEERTLAKIRRWIEAGGTLIVGDRDRVTTVEGKPEFRDCLVDAEGRGRLGRGILIDGKGRLPFSATPWKQDLQQVAGGYRVDRRLKLDGWLREVAQALGEEQGGGGSAAVLPALDDPEDGVLLSRFEEGVLLFNSGTQPVTKTLRPAQAGEPTRTVELPPLALRWVESKRRKEPTNG